MNRYIKILIATFTIFLLFGAGLFTYYKVIERKEIENKYIEKNIEWHDFNNNKPSDMIKIYNSSTKIYDYYLLDDISFNEPKSSSKDIVKIVEQFSNTKLDAKDFPDKLEYDHNTYLQLSNVIVDPIYIKSMQWYDVLETQNRHYSNISNADFYNIPKEILYNNETWYLLTDKVSFEILANNRYNCKASYSIVKRVEEEKATIDGYNMKAIYSGKLITKTGNVKLKYKLNIQSTKKEILPQFSIKLLFISIIAVISILVVFILSQKLLSKKR